MKTPLLKPNIDFNTVRDGRRSSLFYYDVDLSIARSKLAGTHLILPLAGDSVYIDKNPTLIGNATLHFQDTNFGHTPAPVYCEPGFIAKVPFTQILVENLAQAGRIFRIHYGVGIDFLPGSASSIVISGGVVTSSGSVTVTNPGSVTNNTPINIVRSLNSQAFTSNMVVTTGAAGVATYTTLQNPAGSGKTVLIQACRSVILNPGLFMVRAILGTGSNLGRGTNKIIGDGLPTFTVGIDPSVVPSNWSFYREEMPAASFVEYTPESPIIVPPGMCIVSQLTGPNVNQQSTYFDAVEY